MPDTIAPREVIDLDALVTHFAESLQDPAYVLRDDVAADGFARFDALPPVNSGYLDVATRRVAVTLVSDGEDEIVGVSGETFEITVRRVTR